MDFNDLEICVKVIIVGNGSVGKTSMIRQFVQNKYDDNYKKTIGAAFMEKEHYVKSIGERVKFMLWDTAGQEEFDSVTRRYYRGAGACVLAFSTTDRASFQAIEKWNQKVKAECGDICTVLIQNKIDLLDDAVVNENEAEELARKLKVNFFRTSVKKNFNVAAVFDSLAQQYLARHGNGLDLDGDIDLEDEIIPTMNITDTDIPIRTGSTTLQNVQNPFTQPSTAMLESSTLASKLGATQPTDNEVNHTTTTAITMEDEEEDASENTSTPSEQPKQDSSKPSKDSHFRLTEPDTNKLQSRKKKFLPCSIL